MIHEMIGEAPWRAIVSNYRELQKHQMRFVAKLEEAAFHEEPLAKVGEAYISSFSVRHHDIFSYISMDIPGIYVCVYASFTLSLLFPLPARLTRECDRWACCKAMCSTRRTWPRAGRNSRTASNTSPNSAATSRHVPSFPLPSFRSTYFFPSDGHTAFYSFSLLTWVSLIDFARV